jgi:hypothetical protein
VRLSYLPLLGAWCFRAQGYTVQLLQQPTHFPTRRAAECAAAARGLKVDAYGRVWPGDHRPAHVEDSMTIQYTRRDAGCYADGTFGHDHCRAVLANLLTDIDCPDSGLILSLNGPMPDDAWDELDALDALQAVTEDGLVWGFESGDLVLTTAEDC